MSAPTINGQDINIAKVFQAFYLVPDYQREYVWQTEEVERLLTDINDELGTKDTSQSAEYFIGSIVVCPGQSGVLELIDGQQRMTTLFLTLCAIRDRLIQLGQKPPGALDPQIAAMSTDMEGKDEFRYRLDLQYEDSGDILVKIAKREEITKSDIKKTRSIANIANTYDVITKFLISEFGNDSDAVRRFYGYITNKVKIIRIETENVAKALKVFETINDRGVGLDSMDLLKNLLFMKTSRESFQKLKSTWKGLQDTIHDMGEKPLRFLRYFIFSHYEVDILREDEIYTWFTKNEAVCGYAQNPLEFANELLTTAKAYQSFLEGFDEKKNKSPYLESLRLLGGKAARQHLILLLAGRKLEKNLFDDLCREVENLFFCYVITREPTREFERNFAKWAVELRNIKSDSEFQDFVEKRFARARLDLSTRFDDAFNRLTTDMLQDYRVRYILAKLTQYVDKDAYGDGENTRWLSRYTSGAFEVEHILPQNPNAEAKSEFGEGDLPELAKYLGNLALVEESINASLGNLPYSKKRPIYLQSQLLLTKSISEKTKIGSKTKIDAAVSEIDPFEQWSETTIKQRQDILSRIARKVWSVSDQTKAMAA